MRAQRVSTWPDGKSILKQGEEVDRTVTLNENDEITRVLDYWLCLELQSPQKLAQPNAKRFTWHAKSDQDLPWADVRKLRLLRRSRRKGKTWRHAVTFGVIDLRGLMAQIRTLFALEEREGDNNLRIPNYAATLAIVVDDKGHAIGGASFSSLPWALNRLVAAGASGAVDFAGFSGQGGLEETVKAALHEHLINEQILEPDWIDDRGRKRRGRGRRPLNFSDLRKLEELLFEKCGWHPDGLLQSTVCTQGYRTHPNNAREVGNDLLNSFHVPDILQVKSALSGRGWNKIGAGLRSYLNGVEPATRIDVRLAGLEHVFSGTMPAMMPLARWPSKYPLSFAQQFAVNRIMCDLRDTTGIFSVNGPPGTGKTTLLRDVVAAIVFRRAEALAELKAPGDGFGRRTPVKIVNEQYVWPLRPSLGGFGIVVASSNNGAVENVSKELPTRKSIDAPGVSVDYFGAVADGLIADKEATWRQEGAAWGIIAGILGNRENCSRFVQRFWGERAGRTDGDELPEGDNQNEDDKISDADDPEDDAIEGELPNETDLADTAIAQKNVELLQAGKQETGFIGFETALGAVEPQAWSQAVEAFRSAKARVRAATELAQQRALAVNSLTRAQRYVRDAEKLHDAAVSMLANEQAQYDDACSRLVAAQQEFEQALLHKSLITALHRAEEQLVSLASAQPAKSSEEAEKELRRIEAEIERLIGKVERISRQIENEKLLRPGWLARVFTPKRFRLWQGQFQALSQEQRSAGDRKAALDLRRDDYKGILQGAQDWENRLQDALRGRDRALANAVAGFASPIPSVAQVDDVLAEVGRRREHATKRSRKSKEAWDEASRSHTIASTALGTVREEAERCLEVVQSLGVTAAQRKAWELRGVDDNARQLSTPWHDEALWTLRHEAFIAALGLHKAFLRANANQVTDNLKFLSKVLTGVETERGISISIRKIWDTLFLTVPVVSTAFASVPRLFSHLKAEELGWLIIDEGGQATPQAALGSIWRARRSIIVGDPLQIEPVVPMPEAAIEMIREKFKVGHQWHPIANSAQVLADRANKWGTSLGGDTSGLWLGCPLRVHRRCIDPMFKVANEIAYRGMMVYGTLDEHEEDGESAWIDLGSEGAEGHWIPIQGKCAAQIVHGVIARKGSAFTEDGKANIYVVSPFKAAADGIKELLKDGRYKEAAAVDAAKHANRIAGTVHTFQGKEADTVVLLLCGDPAKPRARSGFAARAPNLLNVALTRAKRRIYVVGDYRLWSNEKYFNFLAENLKRITPKKQADIAAAR